MRKKILIGVMMLLSCLGLVGCGDKTLGYRIQSYRSEFNDSNSLVKNIDVVLENEKGINYDQAKEIAQNEFDLDYPYSQINILNKDKNNNEVATITVLNTYTEEERDSKEAKRSFEIKVTNDKSNDKLDGVKILNQDEAKKLEEEYMQETKKNMLYDIEQTLEDVNSNMGEIAIISNADFYKIESDSKTSEGRKLLDDIKHMYGMFLIELNRKDLYTALDRAGRYYSLVMENMYYQCLSGNENPMFKFNKKNYDEAVLSLTNYFKSFK